METRVRFIVVGFFSLSVIAALFLFAFWIQNAGGLSQRHNIMIQFNATASGIRPGSAVLFNGVRVGEVTVVTFDPSNPQRVNAVIYVDKNIPLRTDTRAVVEGQGLMGTSVVALYGGTLDAPLLAKSGQELPTLISNASGASVIEEARRVLNQISEVISDNADSFKNTIKNIDAFASALGRNSDRIDSILAGIEKMTGSGPRPPTAMVYDLSAPSDFPPGEREAIGRVVVGEITATVVFETQKVLLKTASDGRFVPLDVQWTDSLPKLIQKKVIETFENAHYMKSVSLPINQAVPEYQILIDIRSFQINAADQQAVVELVVRLTGENGRIVDARIVRGEAPTLGLEGKEVVDALTTAFGTAAKDIVEWFGNITFK